ncbi:MAG: PorT family protein, partial [Bacteroidota bacterium]|nr:PorT family protein [Bacteroidota bacterium]
NFGLKGGLNLSSIDNNTTANFSSRLGYHLGGLVHIPVSSQIAVQPEVVYSSQGAKYTVSNGAEHTLQLNYINIPVMLQAKVGNGFYAEAGPQIGLLTGVADKLNNVETGFFSSQDFKKSDVAIGFGLGYQGLSGLGVDARYNLGLTNINNVGTNNLKNNALQIGLFYKLKL